MNIVEFLSDSFDLLGEDSSSNPLPNDMFAGNSAPNPGLLARSNIGVVPGTWQNAITQTLLLDSPQADPVAGNLLGAQTPWIQDSPLRGGALPNPTRSGFPGA